MEATPTPTPAVATPTTPTPAPAVATPTPAPMVAEPTPMPQMADGGMTSGSTASFFKSLNVLETTFGILGIASLLYVIYYYRFKLKQDKLINNELQRQIDEIKMNVQSNMKGKYKTI